MRLVGGDWNMTFVFPYIGVRFGTCFLFPYIGNSDPNWLSYFSQGFFFNHQSDELVLEKVMVTCGAPMPQETSKSSQKLSGFLQGQQVLKVSNACKQLTKHAPKN